MRHLQSGNRASRRTSWTSSWKTTSTNGEKRGRLWVIDVEIRAWSLHSHMHTHAYCTPSHRHSDNEKLSLLNNCTASSLRTNSWNFASHTHTQVQGRNTEQLHQLLVETLPHTQGQGGGRAEASEGQAGGEEGDPRRAGQVRFWILIVFFLILLWFWFWF